MEELLKKEEGLTSWRFKLNRILGKAAGLLKGSKEKCVLASSDGKVYWEPVKEQEAVGQNVVHDVLHGDHVLHASPIVALRTMRLAVGKLLELCLEVDELPACVVDDGHALHLLRERSECVMLTVEVCLRRIVEDGHMVVLAPMLAEREDGSLCEFWRVKMTDCNFSLHAFVGLYFAPRAPSQQR